MIVYLRYLIIVAVGVYLVLTTGISLYLFIKDGQGHTPVYSNTLFSTDGGTQLPAISDPVKKGCPVYPSSLKGKLTVNASYIPTENEVIVAAGNNVINGCYEPPGCVANQSLAVIVPYKNRQQHLITLMYHLHPVLQRQNLRYCIFVPEQYDDGAFNKARVMNAGFLEVTKTGKYDFDCLIFHDVDMLLENDMNLHRCQESPMHLSPAIDKFRYKVGYGTNFGGVGAVSTAHYKLVNGHSNRFYGWGGEDSDIETRFKLQGIQSVRIDKKIGRYKMIPHDHPWYFNPYSGLGSFFKSDIVKLTTKDKFLATSDSSGLTTIKYSVKSVLKHQLYTKINIDVRTFLILNVSSSFDGFTTGIEGENSFLTNDRLDSGKDPMKKKIVGFGVEATDGFINKDCSFRRFDGKTVNKTLGLKVNQTYDITYNDLEEAKRKCIELSRFCGSILEQKPGIYVLRASAFMHEVKLRYKYGRLPSTIMTETHEDIAVYAKLCSRDTRYLQILNKPVPFKHKNFKPQNVFHQTQFDLQFFHSEDFKLYYSYSIYSSHRAVLEEKEIVLNKSLGIYDSLSTSVSDKILVFDSEDDSTYSKFLPRGFDNLEDISKDNGILRLKTPGVAVTLLPGCYVCESTITDQNDVSHIKWKWWFEVRGSSIEVEKQIFQVHLPTAKMGSTKYTEGLRKKFERDLRLPAGLQVSDDILEIIIRNRKKN